MITLTTQSWPKALRLHQADDAFDVPKVVLRNIETRLKAFHQLSEEEQAELPYAAGFILSHRDDKSAIDDISVFLRNTGIPLPARCIVMKAVFDSIAEHALRGQVSVSEAADKRLHRTFDRLIEEVNNDSSIDVKSYLKMQFGYRLCVEAMHESMAASRKDELRNLKQGPKSLDTWAGGVANYPWMLTDTGELHPEVIVLVHSRTDIARLVFTHLYHDLLDKEGWNSVATRRVKGIEELIIPFCQKEELLTSGLYGTAVDSLAERDMKKAYDMLIPPPPVRTS